MSEQLLTNESILQQVGVKYYIYNVVVQKCTIFNLQTNIFCQQIFCLLNQDW